jgi:integrase
VRDEIEQIPTASREMQKIAFTILADTGLRIGELQWLTWGDVDFDNKVLHVRPKEGWKPKTGDQRAVPMSVRLRGLMASMARRSQWVVTAAPSVSHPEGDGPISERRLLRSLKRTLTGLGLKGHLHTFRHAFISRALSSGIPESQVRSWVGHVDPDTIKIYTHIASAESQAAMEKLSSLNVDRANSNPHEVPNGHEDKDVEKPVQNQHTSQEPSDGVDAK